MQHGYIGHHPTAPPAGKYKYIMYGSEQVPEGI